MKHIIEVKNIYKSFQEHFYTPKTPVLNGIQFQVEAGKLTGFLGSNGSGKTTTLKCILGFLFPNQGDFSFFGKPGLAKEDKARLGYLPERPFFYEYLSGKEFLLFYAKLTYGHYRKRDSYEVDKVLEQVGLLHAKDRKLRDYSKGMLQRIGMAQAMIHKPELLILDEPMSGLDPDGRHQISNIIRDFASQGKSVFFSSHLLDDVQKICDNLVVIDQGKTIFQGTVASLIEKVPRVYRILSLKNDKLHKENVDNPVDLQKKIQSLLAENHQIIDITNENSALEEAFIRLRQKDLNND